MCFWGTLELTEYSHAVYSFWEYTDIPVYSRGYLLCKLIETCASLG